MPHLDTKQADLRQYAATTTLRTRKSNSQIYMLDFSHNRYCRRNGQYSIFYTSWQIQSRKEECPHWTIRVAKVGIRD